MVVDHSHQFVQQRMQKSILLILMISLTCQKSTKEKYKNLLPSITHVDGSCRLQTINKYQNNFLWSLLKEFEKLSKFPILLNTSFNPGGEPILNYCEVGLQMLKDTDLDFVLIENTLFSKNKDKLKALD